tara:strand:- start:805 stop:1488 length:684 start_codon:yes stop_codon:yes gene_type:complete
MENTFDLKKFLVENKLTTNSKLLKEEATKDEVQKQVFDFINSQEVATILTKALRNITPQQKQELTKNLQTLAEGSLDSFANFKQFTEKGLQASMREGRVNEALTPEEEADFQRGMEDFQRDYGPTLAKMDRTLNMTVGTLVGLIGGVFKTLGVVNIMSMGFLPAIVAAAVDYFAGTNILYAAGALVGGSGGLAAALSVLAGLLGGAILWWLGSALLGEEPDGNSPLF